MWLSCCSHFWYTRWDAKRWAKLGFPPFLHPFPLPGYFWSQCISDKTSINGTEANSLTTNTELYLKLQVWTPHHQLQPLGRQIKSVLSNFTLNPPLHVLNDTAVVAILLLSHVQLCDHMDCRHQASLSFTISLEFAQTHVHWVGDAIQHLILCHPVLLQSSVLNSIRSFPLGQLLATDGQSTGALASASVLTMNIQDWFPLGLSGLMSL